MSTNTLLPRLIPGTHTFSQKDLLALAEKISGLKNGSPLAEMSLIHEALLSLELSDIDHQKVGNEIHLFDSIVQDERGESRFDRSPRWIIPLAENGRSVIRFTVNFSVLYEKGGVGMYSSIASVKDCPGNADRANIKLLRALLDYNFLTRHDHLADVIAENNGCFIYRWQDLGLSRLIKLGDLCDRFIRSNPTVHPIDQGKSIPLSHSYLLETLENPQEFVIEEIVETIKAHWDSMVKRK